MNQHKAGVILSYISETIKILSALLYTPIMLRLLGQSEYGLYQLIHSFVAYLGLLSLGFTASYVRFFSKMKVKNDQEGIARLNGMFLVIFTIIAGIALLCGCVMVKNIKTIFASGLTDKEYETARILMTLMVINVAITFPKSVFTCITSAHERFVFQRLLIVLDNILNPFLAIPILLLGYGSIGVVVVTTCITFTNLIVNIWFVCVKMKEKFIFHNFDYSLLKDIWKFTFFIFLNQIIDRINWSVDRFLLGRMIGTAAVTVYGLGAQINSMYVMLSSSVSSVFVPRVNRLVAESNDNRQLSGLLTKIGRIQFIILSLVLSGFVFFGKPFMIIWGGKKYVESYFVALLLIIPVTIPLIQNLGIEIQRAKNKHQARTIVYFIIALANVLISIPLIRSIGPVGAATGTAISLIIGNIIFMNWYYHKRIGLDIPFFWKQISKLFPALILPIIFGVIIMNTVEISHLVQLIIWACVYTVVFFASMWFLGMNASEKEIVLGIKRKIMKRRAMQ